MQHRVLLCYNYKERELWTLEKLKKSILALAPTALVKILGRGDAHFLKEALAFEPTVVAGCAPTAVTVSHNYYILKKKFNTRVICIPTEGVGQYTDLQTCIAAPHIDSYGPKLLDGLFYWGEDYANAAYPELEAAHKISSKERTFVTGSPLLEAMLTGEIQLPESLSPYFAEYAKENIVLCAGSFVSADYTREMLIQSQDFVMSDPIAYEKRLDALERECKLCENARDFFIQQIVVSAQKNPELLFIVNPHPVERHNLQSKKEHVYKEQFQNIPNILYIDEAIDAIALMQKVGCVLHIGTSGLYGAYISGACTIELDVSSFYKELENGNDIVFKTGFPSTHTVDIHDMPTAITSLKDSFKNTHFDPIQDDFLFRALNYKRDEAYTPAKIMAQAILDEQRFSYQDVEKSLEDMYFISKIKKITHHKNTSTTPLTLVKKILIGSALERVARKVHSKYKSYRKKQQKMPSTFIIESVLGCNLRCVECAIGANLVQRKYGMLSLDNFKIISDKIKPHCKHLYLHLWGEPMLNPNIIEMIKIASEYAVVNISTNANTLTEETAIALARSGVKELIVSIDGMSQDVYEVYRVNGTLTRALEALKTLSLHIPPSVDLVCQFVVFEHNAHEIENFSIFCAENNIKGVLKSPYLRKDSNLCNAKHLPHYHRKISTNNAERVENMKTCNSAYSDFTITLDGTVAACCYDHNASLNFGNILQEDVQSIWYSKKYTDFRNNLKNGNKMDFCIKNCLEF